MYRIYGKHESMKQYQAFDMENFQPVGNLIYATVITENELPKAKNVIDFLNENNTDWKFEIRKVKEK